MSPDLLKSAEGGAILSKPSSIPKSIPIPSSAIPSSRVPHTQIPAEDIQKVANAIAGACKEVDEIVVSTGLAKEVVEECLRVLAEMKLASKSNLVFCGPDAVNSLQRGLKRVCEVCGKG